MSKQLAQRIEILMKKAS